ncbi:type II secretion system F family protein [Chenggangzhangella methanolivorans]|uniref:Type II secretion system F family protein n=1 Tax=Chenggangzhangella methanolivorans TaxID=1437009 RepID=A0A9E6RHL1_9HYPH|nr:type II secretion system F family protein [Chenggangzhangella methanolivorans]QZO01581.1 type II secretion system F family protein [Chenggangzhangella methanolivorans]
MIDLGGKLPIVLLATVAAGGAAYALIYPYLSGAARVEQRQKMVGMDRRRAVSEAAQETLRRGQVSESLKALDDRQKRINRPTLQMRIAQAGLQWSNEKFYIVSAIIAAVFGVGAFVGTQDPRVAGLAAFVGGLGAPRWLLGFLKKRRIAKFLTGLPDGVEIILRGLKAGLPLGDCMRVVANETQEPVKTEFRKIIEEQTVGIPLAEAVGKLYERMPVAEANFFAIVIAIQSKAGGSLSDALGNLAKVLRDRKKIKQKIASLSMEAKASASIIGALPIITIGVISMTSPDYMNQMFSTDIGRFMLAGSAAWMLCGVLVMKKMISFDY